MDTREAVGGRRNRRNPSAAAGAQEKRDGCGRALDNGCEAEACSLSGVRVTMVRRLMHEVVNAEL